MSGRITAAMLLAGAVAFVLPVSPATAGGDSVACKSTSAPVTNMNADGTECETSVFGAGPNKATANASSLGFAHGVAGNGATVTAKATDQAEALADVSAGFGKATASGLGSIAKIDVSLTGGGSATAKGPNASAQSTITSANGGSAKSTASADSSAVADVLSTGSLGNGNAGTATAKASQGGSANSVVNMVGGGKANATASGSGAEAESAVQNICNVSTNAKGASSVASAICEIAGSTVSAEATNGSTAAGSDTVPPTCNPAPGGKAKVRSPMGNCG
jgi:hypothetical protein